MISIIIPTLNGAATLGRTLACINDYRGDKEIIIADGGSSDGTEQIAAGFGVGFIDSPRGRGPQLAQGAGRAQGEWLLFIHSDTVLGEGWEETVNRFIADPESLEKAGCFRFRLDHDGAAARRLEVMVEWRCRTLGLAYGDQGLLISRRFYDAVGGYSPLAMMEDVDIVRRISKSRLVVLDADAITSAERYLADGYMLRSLRNLVCLFLYLIGLPPRMITRIYDKERE